jgi:hypothetical protein
MKVLIKLFIVGVFIVSSVALSELLNVPWEGARYLIYLAGFCIGLVVIFFMQKSASKET